MNSYLKYALFFLGGAVAGAAVTTAVSRGKLNFKPIAADLVSRGMDVKDAVCGAVEKMKENAEDLVAEAREAQSRRQAAAAAGEAE